MPISAAVLTQQLDTRNADDVCSQPLPITSLPWRLLLLRPGMSQSARLRRLLRGLPAAVTYTQEERCHLCTLHLH